ncbi:MAG: hypothetical protein DRH30_07905 [Deltaproteobacteria bacterium]|nr:MAG: hypothetical protein DRH30_07905 [Deltaproteobacteria bacterium]
METSEIQFEMIALVREARNRGWALVDIAEHLGCSFASVSRWDTGDVIPYRNSSKRMVPMMKELLS